MQSSDKRIIRNGEEIRLTEPFLNNEEEAVFNLWIQQQIEQEEIDRNDLQMFEQMNQQEQQDKEEQANAEKARRFYNKLVKKYVNSLSSSYDY